ncbi:MAG: imidazoleglycerol-phosphate dehydratase HisB [Candidatus Omnitrophota bacterium]|nr:MAG: imidazoleglycerol-phosphate dehydratase HisB [Candidatus Omnitrophota bacterium]RKY37920.1 MAG: imidazoleglycerol-phosphate dehydratase HisB [Candidatus Omnitrophota bacterium]RKY46227.1 MAG: imidazoleglycerol-phosphate dehydratase HisB [Candidatus Omnitrophota bacterium]
MRKAKIKRITKEVNIELELKLDGKGEYKVESGIGFLNHMLSLFAKHGLFDLKLKARGDLDVDLHHTNEDIGITLGEAFYKALGKRKKIERFGTGFVCMDEALVRCIVDLSGRSFLKVKPKNIPTPKVTYSYSHFKQFLKAFTDHAKINLHLDILEGEDLHHILEASFKALALALKEASRINPRKKGLPTTKGKLD